LEVLDVADFDEAKAERTMRIDGRLDHSLLFVESRPKIAASGLGFWRGKVRATRPTLSKVE
jgi:hypothetical protein